ncbi:hypothetical protein BDV96DRAFT_569207 [Lophiotrema nucula]|uniref:Uncharacterized protein n=1 Tax=Lophiotrema nucula TaxID=690887 RepID=A0A6A5ZF24_9PLEO|nr:hypothetical protein BDV96DRAFT_569207 [Lophiotrema nucula]
MNPEQWTALPGTLFISRRDDKPLHVAHVEALHAYCDQLGKEPAFWQGLDQIVPREILERQPTDESDDWQTHTDNALKAKAKYMLSRASREGFKQFYKEWRYRPGNRAHRKAPSPYTL